MEIGDIIADVEDGDCYYIGKVTSLNPLTYRLINIVWNGEIDEECFLLNNIMSPMWGRIVKAEL